MDWNRFKSLYVNMMWSHKGHGVRILFRGYSDYLLLLYIFFEHLRKDFFSVIILELPLVNG